MHHLGVLYLAAVAGAVGAWVVLRPKKQEDGVINTAPQRKAWAISSRVPTTDVSPSANTGLYLNHLTNAASKVMLIDGGAETPEESQAVNQAWDDLGAPIDVLTAQKDLNVLGAKPSVVEDGILGPKTRDALVSFQEQMDIPQSGVLDSETNRALRRAVVAVTMQPPS